MNVQLDHFDYRYSNVTINLQLCFRPRVMRELDKEFKVRFEEAASMLSERVEEVSSNFKLTTLNKHRQRAISINKSLQAAVSEIFQGIE